MPQCVVIVRVVMDVTDATAVVVAMVAVTVVVMDSGTVSATVSAMSLDHVQRKDSKRRLQHNKAVRPNVMDAMSRVRRVSQESHVRHVTQTLRQPRQPMQMWQM